MSTTFNSPPDSTAAKALLHVQTGITRIKELIALAGVQNWNDEQLTAKLNKTIAGCCKRFNDNARLKEEVRKSLVNSARKWNWELKNAIAVHNKNILSTAKLDDFNYTVDVSALMGGGQGIQRKEFRNVLNTGIAIGKPLIRDYRRSVTIALRALSAEPPIVAKTRNGKVLKTSLRNVAEMTVRYAANLQDIERLRMQGVLYVWTTSHPNCSPRCMKYQGKLWSLNGTSGTVENKQYRPIKLALAGPFNDGNGIISGYNCRHRLIAWFPGSNAPKEYTEAEIRKAYAIDQKQRTSENNIRQMKLEERLLRISGDEDEAKLLRKKWKNETKKYQVYSLKQGRPYYMYRCMVDESEIDVAEKNLTEREDNDILNAQSAFSDDTMPANSSNLAVRVWYVNKVKGIHENIDQTLPTEEKAKIAFDMRNDIRIKAREAMGDTEKRKELDKEYPNPTFETKIKDKIERKHLSREEAVADVYKTACTTSKKVNKELGIDE